MYEDLKNLLDVVASVLNISLIILLAYIILMGIAYKSGRKTSIDRANIEREKAKEPCLLLIRQMNQAKPFWKDESLINYGTIPLVFMLFSLMFVISTSFLSEYPTDILGLSILMGWPNIYAPLSTWFSLPNKEFKKIGLYIRVRSILIIAAIIAILPYLSLYFFALSAAKISIMVVFVFIIESLVVSYCYGIEGGISDAAFERKLTSVNINLTNDDKKIKGLYFYTSTETDYHFITKEGNECIIPNSAIKQIIVNGSPESPE